MENPDGGYDLNDFSLNKTVEFDGASVCLDVFPDGATLSVVLSKNYSQPVLINFLESAFSIALSYDAGIAIDDREGTLLLTQWLPLVKSWCDAEAAFEKLLNQLDSCRPAMDVNINSNSINSLRSREEQRIRTLFDR